MKNFILVIAMSAVATIAYGQSAKFESAMKSNLSVMDTATVAATFVKSANRFERIALAEKDQWLPYYHSAYAHYRLIFMINDNEQKEEYINKAESMLAKADELNPNDADVWCIKSAITGGRIMLDPMTNSMKYGPQAATEINKAIAADPTNPRPYLQQGISTMYTPEQFGGGPVKALPILEKSKTCFEKFKPKSGLHPNWGAGFVDQMISQCKSMIK